MRADRMNPTDPPAPRVDRATAGVLFAALLFASSAWAGDGPDPILEKPAPVTMAELARRPATGVSAWEVSDYAPARYSGRLAPSPPHADGNAGKAVVIVWKDRAQRFVFSHEASYCPILELPDGAGMCDQFFEGNLGEAELFNAPGRRERNSFVDVIQRGPDRVWVRWTYFAVNLNDDARPRLRGTEDYFAYPNGLVLRRMTYESLMPDDVVGYSTQPVELFGVAPAGARLADLFPRDPQHGDYPTLAAVDLYGDRRYEVYWGDDGAVRRQGDDATLAAIARSPGCALVLPYRQGLLFAVLGRATNFPAGINQLIDHSTPGAEGGAGWGAGRWDHWPVGWLNSQGSGWTLGSPYPYSFGSIGQFFVPAGKPIRSFWRDYSANCRDMNLNRWTARQVCYVLLGAARRWEDVRRIGRSWLDRGAACARPESIADLE